MKIKQKKQLNLPQLIEYIWDNNVKNERYRCSDSNPYEYVWINENSDVELDEDMRISKNDTFTVEIEEEITEETHLDYLYALTNDDEKEIHRCMNFTIRNASMVIGRNDLTFFTLVGNDLVKIYENGKLVE
ncbi:hypothetical protein [Staphylococcus saprophyticus]|uniref:hypothetical protein n=1 Tax=Staphylococcus saprophyticus TaxID=29385 RepID=UPI000E69DB0E|nr:hypothetical protein [Staphylococcus saprophyticus]RIO33877.1 hypothetical protein BUZ74_04220 [Staphylococcus saprophyticus]